MISCLFCLTVSIVMMYLLLVDLLRVVALVLGVCSDCWFAGFFIVVLVVCIAWL